MDIREVFDQLRNYHTKNVKPFEKLPEVIEAAIQIIEHALPAARTELDRLTHRLEELRASIPNVETAVAEAKARVKMATDEADAAEHASHERIGVAERLASAREISLVRDFEHKGATLERESTTRRDVLTAEITALETRKTELDQALAALEAHFSRRPT